MLFLLLRVIKDYLHSFCPKPQKESKTLFAAELLRRPLAGSRSELNKLASLKQYSILNALLT